MTPIPRTNYRIGLSQPGKLAQIFNSDYKKYGGSGVSNKKHINIDKIHWNHREYSAEITLPPLGAVVFKIEE